MNRRELCQTAGMAGIVGMAGCIGGVEDLLLGCRSRDLPTPAPPSPVGSDDGQWFLPRVDVGNTGVHPAASGPRGEGDEVWEFEVDSTVSGSVLLVDGMAVFADGMRTYGVNLVSGTERWTTGGTASTATSESGNPGAVTHVLGTDGDHVFALGEGYLLALAVEDGSVAWRTDIGGLPPDNGGLLLREDELVVHTVAGIEHVTHSLVGIGKADGSRRWHRELEPGPATGVVLSDDHLYFAVGTDGGRLRVETPESKGPDWWGPLGESRPVGIAVREKVYVTLRNDEVYAMEPGDCSPVWMADEPGERSGPPLVHEDVVVTADESDLQAFGADDGDELWDENDTAGVPPVAADGVVYGAEPEDDEVLGLDLRTGEDVFEGDTEGRVTSSIAVGNGFLVVGTEEGVTALSGSK